MYFYIEILSLCPEHSLYKYTEEVRQILVRAECVRQRNEVAIILGIISLSLLLSLSRRLLKTIEGGIVGF